MHTQLHLGHLPAEMIQTLGWMLLGTASASIILLMIQVTGRRKRVKTKVINIRRLFRHLSIIKLHLSFN